MSAALMTVGMYDACTKTKILTIDGVDVLGTYVDVESIDLTEEGPNGVSSLAFTLRDATSSFTMREMANVLYWDITNDRPLFAGWIGGFGVTPWAAVGRDIQVTCIGREVLLDWMVVPNLTVPAGTFLEAAIQAAVANATGVGWPIRAFAGSDPNIPGRLVTSISTQKWPIATANGSMAATITLSGVSLRQAISQMVALCNFDDNFFWPAVGALCTIDFTDGLRLIPTFVTQVGLVSEYLPGDYASLPISDNPAGTYAATGLNIAFDSSQGVHQVYVQGANAASSGLVTDGTGLVGPVPVINDSTIDSSTKRDAAAADYLVQFGTTVRGSLSLDPLPAGFLASGNYRAGGTITFAADPQVFGVAISFTIYAIHKTWTKTTESWAVDYGGFQPSLTKTTRRLTRAVNS